MKLFSRLVLTSLLSLSISQTSFAAESVQGTMVGAQITNIAGSTGVNGGVRYWSEFFGADLTIGFDQTKLESSGTDIVDLTTFVVGGGLLAGIPIDRLKPHIRVGFSYAFANNDVTTVDLSEFDITPSIGVDFLAAEHLVFGLTVASFPIAVDGDIETAGLSADFDGFSIALLNAISISYLF